VIISVDFLISDGRVTTSRAGFNTFSKLLRQSYAHPPKPGRRGSRASLLARSNVAIQHWRIATQ
jgi:hypothetical protein